MFVLVIEFWYTSHMHNTVDRQCSKNSVRERKYCSFKCHTCLISGTTQLYYILPEAVILMSSYLLRFPFLCLIVTREKIILSSKTLPVVYSDVWGHFLNDNHSWSLPVCLIMLCTVDTPKSISCTVYQGIFKVHVQCMIHAVVKKVWSINGCTVQCIYW